MASCQQGALKGTSSNVRSAECSSLYCRGLLEDRLSERARRLILPPAPSRPTRHAAHPPNTPTDEAARAAARQNPPRIHHKIKIRHVNSQLREKSMNYEI